MPTTSGRSGLDKELRNNVRYPALPDGVEPQRCQVVVIGMVGIDGRIREKRIYKSAGEPYDTEALRVVNRLRGTWLPQLIDGEPEESFYTMEVNFLPLPRTLLR